MPRDQERNSIFTDFEDLASDSGGSPRRPDYIVQRETRTHQQTWDIPRWEREPRRTSSEDEAAQVVRRARRSEEPEPRRNRSMSSGRRRGLTALLVLVMAVITALLAIFLVFKIGSIQVVGDEIAGVSDREIIEVAGYETGDNLIFLTTSEQEQRLLEQIPYLGNVEIRRRLPTTLEIRVTAAQPAAAIAASDAWLTVSSEGKILERSSTVGTGTVKVLGLTPLTTDPGQMLAFEDEAAQTALESILSALGPALEESQLPGGFTLLDLRDLSAISLYYEDRVQFLLGNVLELEYKIKAGCRFLADPSAGDNGVMDLTAAPETKRAIFTAGDITLPELPQFAAESGEAAPVPEASVQEPSASPAPRSDGIPQTAYDGTATAQPEATPTPEPAYEPEESWDEPDWINEPDWSEDDDPGETWEEPGETWEDSDEENWEAPSEAAGEEEWVPEGEDEVIDWGG